MDFREDEQSKKPLIHFSQSSLTDIVLLLLIFFLLTSSFVSNFGIKVNVPEAESGVQNEPQYVAVTITDEGKYYVGDQGEPVTQAMLSSAMRQEYRKNPQATIVIRADKKAIIDDAVYVMNVAKALNMKIVIATERGT